MTLLEEVEAMLDVAEIRQDFEPIYDLLEEHGLFIKSTGILRTQHI